MPENIYTLVMWWDFKQEFSKIMLEIIFPIHLTPYSITLEKTPQIQRIIDRSRLLWHIKWIVKVLLLKPQVSNVNFFFFRTAEWDKMEIET